MLDRGCYLWVELILRRTVRLHQYDDRVLALIRCCPKYELGQ